MSARAAIAVLQFVRPLAVALTLTAALITSHLAARAADVNWQGAGTNSNTTADPLDPSTHWTGPNWSPGGVPDDADHAILNFTTSGAVHADALHVEDLTLQGSGAATLRLAGGPFTVDDFLLLGGRAHIVQTSGVHTIGRELNINSTFGTTEAYRLEGGELHTGATAPWWEGEASIGRGGFVQTGGWHNVVHDMNVHHSLTEGGYVLSDGRLTVGSEFRLYGSSAATMKQIGGIAEVDDLQVAVVNSTLGRYELSGGSLSVRNATLGSGGSAHFIQTGGDVSVSADLVLARSDNGSAYYSMTAGTLTAKNFAVARDGDSHVSQQGGVVTVTDTLSFSNSAQGSSQYDLLGGELHVNKMNLGGSGIERIFHDGGDLSAEVLTITDSALYDYRSGALNIGSGLHIRGTMNLANAPVTIDVGPDTIVDLTGTLQNASQLSLSVGPNSLTILRPGLDPSTAFASYSNSGHVAVQGSGYLLAAGQTIRGAGEVFEPLKVHGTVEAAPGVALTLHAVSVYEGGAVYLGAGQALLDRSGSGVSGGTLRANRVTVSTAFIQSAGTVTSDTALTFSSGSQYTLTGGAISASTVSTLGTVNYHGGHATFGSLQVSAGSQSLSSGSLTTVQTGLFSPSTVFTQTGGRHTTGRLRTITRAKYAISGGQLIADRIGVGEDAGGTVEISGAADVQVADQVGFGQQGTLAMSGGRLQTRVMDLSLYASSNANTFAWTGGRLEVESIVGKAIVNDGGTLAPTSIEGGEHPFRRLTIDLGYTQNAGTLEIELGGLSRGLDYDALDVLGPAVLGGVMEVSLVGDFEPRAGDRFDIVSAAALMVDFTTMSLPPLDDGLAWVVDLSPTALSLVVSGPTDLNGDGRVDGADLTPLAAAFGEHDGGDVDNDGDTDGADFLAWQRDAGLGMPTPASQVPEPHSVTLLALTVLLQLRKTRL